MLDEAADAGQVLPRALPEIYENVRDFTVYVDDAGVGGCAALHIDTAELAEVRSVVIRHDLRGQGIGQRLLAATVAEAERLGLQRVYTLTRVPTFFLRAGFQVIDRDALPHKVFKDCLRCPLFPGCDEVALDRPLAVRNVVATADAPADQHAHV